MAFTQLIKAEAYGGAGTWSSNNSTQPDWNDNNDKFSQVWFIMRPAFSGTAFARVEILLVYLIFNTYWEQLGVGTFTCFETEGVLFWHRMESITLSRVAARYSSKWQKNERQQFPGSIIRQGRFLSGFYFGGTKKLQCPLG